MVAIGMKSKSGLKAVRAILFALFFSVFLSACAGRVIQIPNGEKCEVVG